MRSGCKHDRRSVGGRIFFSSTGRSLVDEDEIVVLSVGVDIGSSTSHLVFSRIVLERLDSRYVVTQRETFYQSDILLTPYSKQARRRSTPTRSAPSSSSQYKDAKVDPDEIDTGALILTGVAVRRRNARKIGELFARQAGKMVAVSAGDNLETVMAAYGSGAVGALDPRQGDRDERRRRRRHLEDRGLRRRQGDRPHRGRRRRAARLPRRGRQASCASRKPAGASPPSSASSSTSARRLRPRTRARSPPAWRTACSRRCGAASPQAGGSGLCRLDPLTHRGTDRPGHLLGRRLRIHLRPRGDRVRRSRRAAGAGDPRAASRPGARRSSARTKASAPPSSAPRNTPRR